MLSLFIPTSFSVEVYRNIYRGSSILKRFASGIRELPQLLSMQLFFFFAPVVPEGAIDGSGDVYKQKTAPPHADLRKLSIYPALSVNSFFLTASVVLAFKFPRAKLWSFFKQ
jgi:hypothetical protein